jgi:hypothetical protein
MSAIIALILTSAVGAMAWFSVSTWATPAGGGVLSVSPSAPSVVGPQVGYLYRLGSRHVLVLGDKHDGVKPRATSGGEVDLASWLEFQMQDAARGAVDVLVEAGDPHKPIPGVPMDAVGQLPTVIERLLQKPVAGKSAGKSRALAVDVRRDEGKTIQWVFQMVYQITALVAVFMATRDQTAMRSAVGKANELVARWPTPGALVAECSKSRTERVKAAIANVDPAKKEGLERWLRDRQAQLSVQPDKYEPIGESEAQIMGLIKGVPLDAPSLSTLKTVLMHFAVVNMELDLYLMALLLARDAPPRTIVFVGVEHAVTILHAFESFAIEAVASFGADGDGRCVTGPRVSAVFPSPARR